MSALVYWHRRFRIRFLRVQSVRQFLMPEASNEMIVDHAGGLHEGVADGAADETEAAFEFVDRRPRAAFRFLHREILLNYNDDRQIAWTADALGTIVVLAALSWGGYILHSVLPISQSA